MHTSYYSIPTSSRTVVASTTQICHDDTMSLFSVFSAVVMAAEMIISPIPDNVASPVTVYPSVSFGQLTGANPTPAIAVLGVSTTSPTPTPSPRIIPDVAPKEAATESGAKRIARKKQYTIAFLGDSMVDTLGPDVPHTKKALAAIYPGTSFTLLNFGVGATNIDYGLQRVSNGYDYLGKAIPSVVSQRPDIVVVESFGYNPYSYEAGALDKHWLQLAAIVDSLKAQLPGVRIVIAATIAPNSKVFGDGAAGLAFDPADKIRRTTTIKQYLDSTVKFAKSQKLPLADVFHASIDASGDGKLTYINGGDHIHYSDNGRILFGSKVAEAIASNRLLE